MVRRNGGFIGTDGLDAPDPPTGVTASGGVDGVVSISFTAPTDAGTSSITGFNIQTDDGSGTWETTFNLSEASFDSVELSINSQDSLPQDVAFNTTGTKMFIVGRTEDKVHQYTLTTGFDLSTASYDDVEFSVNSQEANPTAVAFNTTGTKMYICGIIEDKVFQYTLTTGFDLSTASYDSVELNVRPQDTQPNGIAFNTDGTKMFICGTTNDSIFQYTLTTGFDLSTASYASVSFDADDQDTDPQGVAFNIDGTKMFIAGGTNDSVYQYTLSTAFAVNTASFSSSFSVNSQDTYPGGLTFNADGTKMYVIGSTNDKIYQYSVGNLDYPTASPVSVTGLTLGTAVTFRAYAVNAYGTSAASNATDSITPAAARAVFGGGDSSTANDDVSMDFVSIATTGNSSNFGDLSVGRNTTGSLGSSTRGVWAGGQNDSGRVDIIDYVTIATEGNASDFGNLLAAVRSVSTMSNTTRGVFSGGYTGSYQNVIQYITIATTGNSTDFGDSTVSVYTSCGCASPTRGVSSGGTASGGKTNVIEYITIANTGNATDFGDLTATRTNQNGFSSSVRGVFGGGNDGSVTDSIDYITIATTGNATDFGNLSAATQNSAAASSNIRGIFAGGSPSGGGKLNTLEYVTIASTGNTTDFGDLADSWQNHKGCSNGHGGLQ